MERLGVVYGVEGWQEFGAFTMMNAPGNPELSSQRI